MQNYQLKYPVRRHYQNQRSSIRYQYQHPVLDPNGMKINHGIVNYITWEQNNIPTFCHVSSAVLITALEMFRDIIVFWDAKSKDINHWSSCFFLKSNADKMLRVLKEKFACNHERIRFHDVDSIYNILNYQTSAPQPVKKIFFKIWKIAENNQNQQHYLKLLSLIEGLAKAQLIYLIPSYKSRGNRPYVLPWEITLHPDVKYYKKYSISKIKKRIDHYSINVKKSLESSDANSKQKRNIQTTDIRNYFTKKKESKKIIGKKRSFVKLNDELQSVHKKRKLH